MILLEIFIGLVLVYVLYSLLTSIIAEILSGWLGLRARHLRQGIENLLNGEEKTGLKGDFYSWIREEWLVEKKGFNFTTAGKFYAQPEIRTLAKKGQNLIYTIQHTKPAYLTKATYSKTLISILTQKSRGNSLWEQVQFSVENNTLNLYPEVHSKLKNLLKSANGRYELFVQLLEDEFDEMMDRVNGWYKRRITFIIFWLGFFICLIGNVDTIKISKLLAKNETVRKEMVALAEKTAQNEKEYVKNSKTPADSSQSIEESRKEYKKIKEEIDQVDSHLGLGWKFEEKNPRFYSKVKQVFIQITIEWAIFLGILITALALTLGSQFWFDLLKKLVAIRSAGIKPDEGNNQNTTNRAQEKAQSDGKFQFSDNPVDVVISEHGREWEGLNGFLGYNKIITPPSANPSVEILIDNGFKLPLNAVIKGIDIIFKNHQKGVLGCVVGNTDYAEGSIRQDTTNSVGTVAGIVYNPRTGRPALLTCGHVLRTAKNGFFEKDETTASVCNGTAWVKVGKVSNVVMSCFADGGIVDIEDPNSFDFDQFTKITQIREVRKSERFIQNYNIHLKSGIMGGVKIVDSNTYFTFNGKSSGDLKYFELLMMQKIEIPTIDLTQEGDSGALVTDTSGVVVGVVVGGSTDNNDRYTYAIKITDLFDILQIKLFTK